MEKEEDIDYITNIKIGTNSYNSLIATKAISTENMCKLYYGDFIELVNITDYDEEIEGISYNSKKVQPNDIFVCLTGEHVDGHEYAEEALRRIDMYERNDIFPGDTLILTHETLKYPLNSRNIEKMILKYLV